MSGLESALAIEPVVGSLPIPLPLGHLVPLRHLAGVLLAGNLVPQPCKVLGSNLLYFSYGGVSYRKRSQQTQSEIELPAAFVFSPVLLDEINRVFPFDTGAMGNKLFGDDWATKLAPFETTFGVSTANASETTSKLVHHLYGSNKAYLFGETRDPLTAKADPLPLLHEFLSQDLTGLATDPDHRQRSIECIADVSVAIGKTLLWVGYPSVPGRSDSQMFADIYNWTKPNVPQFWAYEYHRNFNPLALAEVLEVEARKQVVERYVSVPA